MRSWSAWLIPPTPKPEAGSSPIKYARYYAYTHKREVKRFVKFAMVGAVGALVDFSILNLLILGFGWAKVAANTVSFVAAVLSNFPWNRLWTFPASRQRPLARQLGQFALVNLIGLGINQLVFLYLDYFLFTPMFGTPPGYNLAKASAIIVVLFWNFIVNRLWTFRGLGRL